MPKKIEKYRQVLKRYLLLICLFTAGISLIFLTVFAYKVYKEDCFRNLGDVRDRELKIIEGWFSDREQGIIQLTYEKAAKERDFQQLKAEFQKYLYPFVRYFDVLVFADKSGDVLLAEGNLQNSKVNVAKQEYFRLAMEGKSNISETIISQFTGKYAIAVTSPVFSEEGEISGAIIGFLNIQKLKQILSWMNLEGNSSAYLLDKNGIIMTVPYYTLRPVETGTVDKTGEYRYQLKEGAALGLAAGEGGYGEYDNYQASRVFGAYKAMDKYAWSLAVEVEKTQTLQPFREKLIKVYLLFSLFYFLILLPLLKEITRRLVLPLEQFSAQVIAYTGDCLGETTACKWEEGKTAYEEIAVINHAFQKVNEKNNNLLDMMRVQALYDSLTGLANKRHFFARGQEIIELVRRKLGFCSLIYFEIDEFKQINDHYGSRIGNQVLIYIAEVLGKVARISDVAGRLAEKEFAVILPETDGKGAMQFAERFRKYLAEIPVEAEYQQFHIAINIGLSTFKSDGKETEGSSQLLEVLINQSSQAMARAKENGGNRVESFGV